MLNGIDKASKMEEKVTGEEQEVRITLFLVRNIKKKPEMYNRTQTT